MTQVSLLDQPVTEDEIRQYPLMHGTLLWPERAESIRHTGLLAPSVANDASNSFEYDRVLGRTEYVYLAPPTFHGSYGFGTFVLVDPVVLDIPGNRYSALDIGEAVAAVRITLDGGVFAHPWKVSAYDVLQRLVSDWCRTVAEDDWSPIDVVASPAFREYYDHHYWLDQQEWLTGLAEASHSRGFSFRAYFERRNGSTWNLSEEILVPQRIDPAHLLGYWDGSRWHSWASPSTSASEARLNAFLIALQERG